MRNIKSLAKSIDHTFLKSTARPGDIDKICREALQFEFAAVCVPPRFVQQCHFLLKDTNVNLATVIGFPLGYNSTEAKVYETQEALRSGANEIDMVLSLSDLKAGLYDEVYDEIYKIKSTCQDHILKVIVETADLNFDDKVLACQIVQAAKADYIKTSTGFSSAGAQLEDVLLFKKMLSDHIKIKASGGIRTAQHASQFIEAGASRLGTSAGVKIVTQTSTD